MNLVDCLGALNRWWVTGRVDDIHLYKRIRSEFSSIVRQLDSDRIIALTGPACCGKTTLLYQVADYLIKLGVPAARILYFAGDEPSLFAHEIGIGDIVRAYCASILREDPEKLLSPVYLLIDDVDRIRGWRTEVRRFLQKYPSLKLIVTAPSDRQLYASANDDLRLKTDELRIFPLTSRQFIEFYCSYKDSNFDYITYKSLLPDFGLMDNPREYIDAIFANVGSFSRFRQEKVRMIDEYLISGGYPGYFGSPGAAQWHKRMREEIIDRCLYADILSRYSIKSPEKLKYLLYHLACGNGLEQPYAGIGRLLSLNTVTVINHLRLLEECGLIMVCENYTGKKPGIIRKNKRIYLRDTGVKNALIRKLAVGPEDYADEVSGVCAALAGEYAQRGGGRVFFWRSYHNEVDFVIESGASLLPVQVIYKNNISKWDIRGLTAFTRSHLSREAIVVTKDTLAIEKNIYYIPFWLL